MEFSVFKALLRALSTDFYILKAKLLEVLRRGQQADKYISTAMLIYFMGGTPHPTYSLRYRIKGR